MKVALRCAHCLDEGCTHSLAKEFGVSQIIISRIVSGKQSSSRKLTAEQIAEIKSRYEPGWAKRRHPNSSRALAAEYGVADSAIRSIVAGRSRRGGP